PVRSASQMRASGAQAVNHFRTPYDPATEFFLPAFVNLSHRIIFGKTGFKCGRRLKQYIGEQESHGCGGSNPHGGRKCAPGKGKAGEKLAARHLLFFFYRRSGRNCRLYWRIFRACFNVCHCASLCSVGWKNLSKKSKRHSTTSIRDCQGC